MAAAMRSGLGMNASSYSLAYPIAGTSGPQTRRIGSVELEQRLFRDDRRDLGADAPELLIFVDDERAARLGHALQDRRPVHRPDRTQVDDLGVDALAGDLVGGFDGEVPMSP